MIPDSILLLAVCIPALLFVRGPLQMCAIVMLGSFISITGYERWTGGYAVDGFYILADLGCAAVLSFLLLHGWNRPALLVLLGFWVCNIIHGLKLIIDPQDLNFYWWSLRTVNACQILVIGGAGVAGGKRDWRRRALLGVGLGRIPDMSAVFRGIR